MKTRLPRLVLAACLAVAPAVPALAQDVVYSEGFEAGLGAWTASGLWNLENATDPCAAPVAPFAEGTRCAWYGWHVNCNYDLGMNSGTLAQNDWVQLPNAPSISLHFWMWIQSEYCFDNGYGTPFDVASVTITREGGPTITQLQCQPNPGAMLLLPWHERQVDISSFAGARVKISFTFDTVDMNSNAYRGWYVDDVRILAEPASRICPSATLTTGCPCGPPNTPVAGGCRNSTGQSCTLFTQGNPSVSADTIQLRAEHMPPVASAILTQASGTGTPVVFVDGVRCISGQLLRMGSLFASGGVGTWPLAGESISVRGMIPAAGATRYYYAYYRDVQNYCTPATANLSDTRRIVWGP